MKSSKRYEVDIVFILSFFSTKNETGIDIILLDVYILYVLFCIKSRFVLYKTIRT